jgi:hypothetical protein
VKRVEPFAAACESRLAMGICLPILAAFRPYRMHALLLAYTPALLFVDGRIVGQAPQFALGLLTFAVLLVSIRGLDSAVRWQIWICVPVATLFEVFGSLIWGGYHYRLHNIPLYVPPGHALVYVFGITAGALPLMRRHGTGITHLVLGLATVWTLAGLTVLPLTGHRLDLVGAALWPLFAWCILRSSRPMMFAAIWVATATLEIAGTLAGDWTWVAVTPWSHLASGNPPSAIAAGYAVIDGSVALVAAAAVAALVRLRRPAPSGAAVAPAATTML